MIKLSHSSTTCFQDCPKKYEYRYRQKLYSKFATGGLLFGSAIDESIGVLLTKNIVDAYMEFESKWAKQEINKKEYELEDCTLVRYSSSDYDYDLLTPEDLQYIKDKNEWEDVKEEMKSIINQKDVIGYKYLKREQKQKFNRVNWLCLLRKGYLMIDAFHKHILPNIEHVYGIQVKVELENAEGDNIVGFADFIVKWKDIVEPVILDLKTSARMYDTEAVLTSPQLSLYLNALSPDYQNTRKAGYIVLHKNIKKNKTKVCSVCGFNGDESRHKTCPNEIEGERCGGEWIVSMKPESTVQILINDIPEHYENMVLENINMINVCIKNNIFTRSFSHCQDYFGCDYYDLCHKGKDEDIICMKVDKTEEM